MSWCRPSLVDGTMYPTDRVKITCTCDMADGAVVVALKAYRDADQSGWLATEPTDAAPRCRYPLSNWACTNASYDEYSHHIHKFDHPHSPATKILNNNIDPVVTGSAAPTLRPPRCGPVMQAGMGWEAWLRWRLAREMFDNIQCSRRIVWGRPHNYTKRLADGVYYPYGDMITRACRLLDPSDQD